MITPVSVAARIWIKTNSILIFAGGIWILKDTGNGVVAFYIFLALLFGFFLTSPLLIFIAPLVKLSAALPYANRSKMAWLSFTLSVLYLLIFAGVCGLIDGNLNGIFSKESNAFFLSIIVVELIAVRTSRKSLYKFYEHYTYSHE